MLLFLQILENSAEDLARRRFWNDFNKLDAATESFVRGKLGVQIGDDLISGFFGWLMAWPEHHKGFGSLREREITKM